MTLRNDLGGPVGSVAVHTNPVVIKLAATVTDASKILTVSASPSERLHIYGIVVKYTSTATVGNRTVELEIRDDADAVLFCDYPGADINQAASLVYYYQFFPGVTTDTAIVAGTVNFAHRAIPPTLLLPESFDIFVRDKAAVTANLDTVEIWCYCNREQVERLTV